MLNNFIETPVVGRTPHQKIYVIIAISLIPGLSLNYVGISPVKPLIYTAILYGITAPVLISIILHISNNKKIMGDYVNGTIANILGFSALFIMTLAADY